MSDSATTERFTIDIPDVPKSLNRVAKKHWAVFDREKKRLEGNLYIALHHAKVPRQVRRVYVEAVLRFPQVRRRDEGNFRSTLEKALGDALQLGWLPDDTPEHFEFGPLRFDDATGPARTLLFMEVQK